ncbi:MAG: hypothetical protein OHK0029_14870 [Armatimonadaceae bacterium]
MRNLSRRLRGTRSLIPVALLGAGVVLAPVLANDWPELRGDATRRGVAAEKVLPPLSLLWRFSAGPQNQNTCAPTVVGDSVYYATRANGDANAGGVLFALDTQTGARKWQYPPASAGDGLRDRHLFLTAPLVYEGRVYVGASDGNLYILDANTGNLELRLRTGRAINSAPTIVDGVLYFGSNDGIFYALDPKTGEQVWRELYKPGDSVNSAPIAAAGYLFFTTTDNSIHAVLEKTGIFRWKLRLPYRILPNSAIYSDNSLFIPAGPELNSIQPTSGFIRWRRKLPYDILAAPVADDGVVYVACRQPQGAGALMYAFRSSNGKLEWEKPAVLPVTPSAPPTISGNVIYIPTQRNVLLALDRTTGNVIWQYYIEPSSNRPIAQNNGPQRSATIVSAPISVSDNTVYALTDDGALSAFRPDAPDSSGPVLSELYPPVGRAVNGAPPLTLAAKITDVGSGLNPETIEMQLDGRPVEATFDETRNLTIYQTRDKGKLVDPSLENGRHNVTITVADWKGNKTVQTWSFRVDNSLPKPSSRETPAPPRPGISAPGAGNQPQNSQQGGRGGGRRGGGRRGGGNPGGNPNTPPPPPGNPGNPPADNP